MPVALVAAAPRGDGKIVVNDVMWGEVVERVEHDEAVRITRDGRPVAELRPLEAARPTLPALLARFRSVPPMNPADLRKDIDDLFHSSL